MLHHDSFVSNLIRRMHERGSTVSATTTTDPTPPEVTVQQPEDTRGIHIDDNIRELMRDDMDSIHNNVRMSMDDISRAHWDMRLWQQLHSPEESSGLVYNTLYNTVTTYRPFQDGYDRLNKLDQLEKAVAEMVTRREHAFKMQNSSTDAKIVDYGVQLADLFKELYPDLYQQAVESANYLPEHEEISTDN